MINTERNSLKSWKGYFWGINLGWVRKNSGLFFIKPFNSTWLLKFCVWITLKKILRQMTTESNKPREKVGRGHKQEIHKRNRNVSQHMEKKNHPYQWWTKASEVAVCPWTWKYVLITALSVFVLRKEQFTKSYNSVIL